MYTDRSPNVTYEIHDGMPFISAIYNTVCNNSPKSYTYMYCGYDFYNPGLANILITLWL